LDAQRRVAFEYALNVAGYRPLAIQAHDVVLPDPAEGRSIPGIVPFLG
jgi:hypothetical protein